MKVQVTPKATSDTVEFGNVMSCSVESGYLRIKRRNEAICFPLDSLVFWKEIF